MSITDFFKRLPDKKEKQINNRVVSKKTPLIAVIYPCFALFMSAWIISCSAGFVLVLKAHLPAWLNFFGQRWIVILMIACLTAFFFSFLLILPARLVAYYRNVSLEAIQWRIVLVGVVICIFVWGGLRTFRPRQSPLEIKATEME